MYENITDRKIAEEKLKESEENYRLISENVNDLISVINFKLKYEYINEERHKKILGYTEEDLLGNSALHLIHPADRKRSIKVLREGEVSEGRSAELRFQHNEGHYVWLEVKGRGFTNNDGEYKVYMIARDITERKKAEQKIENLMNELERRVKYRTSKLEKSEEKYRLAYNRANCFKGLFTHDINNMFHAIRNAIELFEMEEDQTISLERLTETFELVKRQIKRGTKLIENIQNLSEIEQSEMKLEPIEVNSTIKNAIEFVKNNFKYRKIKVSIKSFQEEIYVNANELLVDVFENILINSVRYTKTKKVIIDIEISALKKYNSEYIKIEFKDYGIGIPDSQKNLIFQEKTPKPNSKGLGLGLSYVAKLLNLCYGKIRVENRIEEDYTKGSNFIVEIPRSKIKVD
jgi:PAS domain S-box-containing protein